MVRVPPAVLRGDPAGLTSAADSPPAGGLRLRVSGVVQGVGFRPFVHRLALRHGLRGWVSNTGGDVSIEIEGAAGALDAFVGALRLEAPPLARVDALALEAAPAVGRDGFEIRASQDERDRHPPVSPDVALCAACETELFDPTSRRYRYPFITCTDCGPRFSVIEGMPYDRERTTMRPFVPCAVCEREYRSPGDRRHHSESNSCPACGPALWFVRVGESRRSIIGEAALAAAHDLVLRGGVLALRGLGGFHLAVDATSAPAIELLRQRKHREAKPFAVMVRTPQDAERVADLSDPERRLLDSAERPIVLIRPRPGAPFAANIAPGLNRIGLFLAYTPLHHLLLDLAQRPLVMTSGNLSDEPLAAGNAEALERLGRLADGFLLHDREIVAPIDDSVVRASEAGPILLRRARGHAPLPLRLPVAPPRPLVALGAHLKSTFALADGHAVFVSPHLGDLESLETLAHLEAMLAHCRGLFRIDPELVVRDLHPGYLSTRLAEALGHPVTAVQHHHAHIAAVMAEHGVVEPVVGLAFDGTGYGEDGNVWGGEVLLADLTGYRRLGHLRYAPLPGGDLAARTPWRAALGFRSLEPGAADVLGIAFEGVKPAELAVAERQVERGFNCPFASSMGRLFDAAAAILGVRRVARYEGQAAMELEAAAEGHRSKPLPFPISGADDDMVLDPVPLLVALAEQRRTGRHPGELAAAFHESVAAAAEESAARACAANGACSVALGGGVFQNARLLGTLAGRLEARGLRVLIPRALSPNDGAVSFGQAAVAAARAAVGGPH
jgi:hydrogenase maturation protein HypF